MMSLHTASQLSTFTPSPQITSSASTSSTSNSFRNLFSAAKSPLAYFSSSSSSSSSSHTSTSPAPSSNHLTSNTNASASNEEDAFIQQLFFRIYLTTNLLIQILFTTLGMLGLLGKQLLIRTFNFIICTAYGRYIVDFMITFLPFPVSSNALFSPPLPNFGVKVPNPVTTRPRTASSTVIPTSEISLHYPIIKPKKKRHTLVLDLDETLVHTTDAIIPVYDCRVDIHTRSSSRCFYILKRPHLDAFLFALSPYYHIVIFTASIRRYADAVIDLIDPHQLIERRLFRPSCTRNEAHFVKDLDNVSRDRRRLVLIDNSPMAYSMNEENAIPIDTWYDDPTDTQLRDLIPFLLALRCLDDVRSVLGRRKVLVERVEANAIQLVSSALTT
jgi:Dullard-like phosphatase family protein